MPSIFVTCPETAHLEEIEYEDTPCGMVVTSCSRLSPSNSVTCARTCTARLDRKRGVRVDDELVEADTLVSIRLG
jgi:hypothetical protein